MTKKKNRLIMFFVLGTLFLIWLTLCIKVNIENPPIPEETHYVEEPLIVNNREITLVNTKMLHGEETKVILAETDPNWYKQIIEEYSCDQIKMLLVTVKIKNIGNELINNAFSPIADAMMVTPTDTLSLMYDDVTAMINEKNLGESWSTLNPSEEKQIVLAYFLESSWMSTTQWNKINDMPFEFILDDYPKRIVLSSLEN